MKWLQNFFAHDFYIPTNWHSVENKKSTVMIDKDLT